MVIDEKTKVPLSVVIAIAGALLAGTAGWYTQKARVDSLDSRLEKIEFVLCRIESKTFPGTIDSGCNDTDGRNH